MGTVNQKKSGQGSERDRREHLLELMKDFDTVFLVTQAVDGPHGRPMSVAQVTDDGLLYFPSGYSDPKTSELAADSHAGVYMQGKTRWVALAGTATVVKDRALVDKLWNEGWKLWFPRGKDDPDLAFVRFDPASGEYWDNSGKRGVRFVIEAAKAYLQHREPDAESMDEHAKVRL
jgi:general stress protein 26